jgi:hypothetical protein
MHADLRWPLGGQSTVPALSRMSALQACTRTRTGPAAASLLRCGQGRRALQNALLASDMQCVRQRASTAQPVQGLRSGGAPPRAAGWPPPAPARPPAGARRPAAPRVARGSPAARPGAQGVRLDAHRLASFTTWRCSWRAHDHLSLGGGLSAGDYAGSRRPSAMARGSGQKGVRAQVLGFQRSRGKGIAIQQKIADPLHTTGRHERKTGPEKGRCR